MTRLLRWCLGLLSIASQASTLRLQHARQVHAQDCTYNYNVRWIEQLVDHFSFGKSPATFMQRYLISDEHWDTNEGPVLFYTGNEGDITLFACNTGFVWELAQEMRARVVFAEHRYYGASSPCGQSCGRSLPYLTSAQALADFAVLVTQLQASSPRPLPFVAFGGSYGGMLSAWLRIKYPHIVAGAISASAPVLQFTGLADPTAFYRITTEDFAAEVDSSGKKCSDLIRDAFTGFWREAADPLAWGRISQDLSLCSPIDSSRQVGAVRAWLEGGLTYLAMTDYPYASSFLEPMPAWPVRVSCRDVFAAPPRPAARLAAAVRVYYNAAGDKPCNNVTESATAALGVDYWDYQACTEMVMPMEANGVSDMFLPSAWNLTHYEAMCRKRWDAEPRPDWIAVQYGGRALEAASNIVFTNGELDPWRGGGVTRNLSDTVIALVIPGAAHHLDLRASHPHDPPAVRQVRDVQRAHIARWITQFPGSART